LLSLIGVLQSHAAGTLLKFKTSLGEMMVELYDQEKPITTTNFLTYVDTGKFHENFIQRWETNFVIQAGGFYWPTNAQQIQRLIPFGAIKNEFTPDPKFSNKYGTIAMARSANVDSATSQCRTPQTNQGFTVFGHVISGTNILNLFKLPAGQQDPKIYQANFGDPALSVTPVLSTNFLGQQHMVFVEIERFSFNLAISFLRGTSRQISWNSIKGVENIVETSRTIPPQWTTLQTVIGDGNRMSITDATAKDPVAQFYRIRVRY
jgi:cyclophilin family peptidyl-prolyl cis-trans isomerase